MRKEITQAIGENYPLWFEAHIPIRTDNHKSYFGSSKYHVFCDEYENPQKNLPGIKKDFSDGIEKLREISRLAL